ncbi:MAG: selenium metabolism-associated LysR family transcriptional regulator [Bacillota bacterium]|nr:selenium metabolism-associated LysR family transcriptional regulator [Bacillota bacterium]
MYNYKQLLAFVTVVDEGGFTPAANKLFITQPAVSWQIKSMEKALDVLLIERSEREVQLTPAGEILYRNAKIIIDQYHVLNEDMDRYRNNESGNVRIAASTIPGEYLLSSLIKNFRQTHSDINTKVYISDSKEVVEKVISGSVCFGITGFKPDHPDLEIEPFVEERLKLVCSMDYPVQRLKDLSAIVKEPIIMREEGSGTKAVTLDYLKKNGFSMSRNHKNMVFGSTKSSLSAIESGLGIGWLSEYAISDSLKLNHIKTIDDAYDIPRQLYIITYKKRTLSKGAVTFRSYISKNSKR